MFMKIYVYYGYLGSPATFVFLKRHFLKASDAATNQDD